MRGKKEFVKSIEPFLLSEIDQDIIFPLSKGEKLQWKCTKCSGVWLTSLSRRQDDGQGCPFCAGQKVLEGYNDLASRYPELVFEYSSKNMLKPTEITAGSGRKVLWNCSKCKQEFESAVGNRTNLKRGCPFCNGKKTIIGVNDLATLRPELVAEWAQSNKKGPENYTLYSNISISWICKEGHEWKALVATRALGKSCKKCSRKESSLEKELYSAILSIYSGKTIPNDRDLLQGLELDILLPEINIAFEFNGDYWHSDSFLSKRGITAEELHTQKIKLARDSNVSLFYVWESDWKLSKVKIINAIEKLLIDSSDIDPILQIVSKG